MLTSTLFGDVVYSFDSNPSVAGTCNCKDNSTTGATFEALIDAFNRIQSYDPATCIYSLTDGSQRFNTGPCSWSVPLSQCNCGPSSPVSGIPAGLTAASLAPNYPGCCAAVNVTPTQNQLNFTAGCSWGSLFCGPSGTAVTEVLSNPDTDSNAIFRFLAANPYGPWSSGSPSSCLAYHEQRTGTQTTFAYAQSQFQLNLSALTPEAVYELELDVWQAAFGTTAFSLFQTQTFIGTVNSAGNLQILGTLVPNIGSAEYFTNPRLIRIS